MLRILIGLVLSTVTLGTIEAQQCTQCTPKGNCIYGGLGSYVCPTILECFQNLDCGSACACDYEIQTVDICTCRITPSFRFDVCQPTGENCGFTLLKRPATPVFDPFRMFRLKDITAAIWQRVFEPWSKIQQCQRTNQEYGWQLGTKL